MRAVVKAMNRDLEGYDLLDSMTCIRDQYEINEEKLIKFGLLKRHQGVQRRAYYTVTRDGQKVVKEQQKHGYGVGDLGDDTPHRVGVELSRRFYEGHDDVLRTEVSRREHGGVTDVAVYDRNFDRVATVEVEGGRITSDPHTRNDASPGTNNLDSIRKDHDLLAECPGESVWVVRHREIAGTVLRALNSGDMALSMPQSVIKDVEDGSLRIPKMNDRYIKSAGAPGIDEIRTFAQLRQQ